MAGGAVLSGNPYSKEQQLARGERRYRRRTASPKQWQTIAAAKLTKCRVCGFTNVLEMHHLVPRDRHGDDVADNIVPLCSDCHRGVELREPAHCRLMLTRLSDAEYAYAIGKLGEGFAESVYGVECER